MKSNSVMTFAYDAMSRTLGWLFSDGTTAEFQHAEVPGLPERELAALVHGYKQKIADAAAIAKNTETGKSATVAEKRAAMLDVIGNLNNGLWNAPSGGGNIGGLLAQAIANVDGKNLENVRAFLKDLDATKRAAIAGHKRYAKEYKRLQDAQLVARAAGIAVDDILGELDAIK